MKYQFTRVSNYDHILTVHLGTALPGQLDKEFVAAWTLHQQNVYLYMSFTTCDIPSLQGVSKISQQFEKWLYFKKY